MHAQLSQVEIFAYDKHHENNIFKKNQWRLIFFNNRHKQTHIEYGILKFKQCEKYLLTEDEDGSFFHSGIDGSLFTAVHQRFYTNEEYCVEYFYYSDEEDPDEKHQVYMKLL